MTVPESWNAVVVVLLITACIFAYGVHVLVHPDAGTNPSTKPRGIQPPDAEQTAALRERYSEFADAWQRWQETPRGPGDRDRLVTVEDVWGGPDPGESFPPRYTASHLGKVTLERRRYLSLEEEMTNGPEVVWAASRARGIAPPRCVGGSFARLETASAHARLVQSRACSRGDSHQSLRQG